MNPHINEEVVIIQLSFEYKHLYDFANSLFSDSFFDKIDSILSEKTNFFIL